jgi:hypothetical protein
MGRESLRGGRDPDRPRLFIIGDTCQLFASALQCFATLRQS